MEGPGAFRQAGLAGSAITAFTIMLCAAAILAILCGPTSANNLPPTAVIRAPEDGSKVLVGTPVLFDGSASIDDDLVNLTFEWNFSGDLVYGKDKAKVNWTFHTPGDYVIVLRVIDSGERDNARFVTVHVVAENLPPVAVITEPEEGKRILVGRSITFDGSASFDPEGEPLLYRWETDVHSDPLESVAEFTQKLPLGDYRITLWVYDYFGVGSKAVRNISVVPNSPPTLSGGNVEPVMGPWDLLGGFNFTVTYTDMDNDPPLEIMVKVEEGGRLTTFDMGPLDEGDTDHRDGRAYGAVVALEPGSYKFVFSCKDEFFSCATALFKGPVVFRIEELRWSALGAAMTINWTTHGTVVLERSAAPSPTIPGVMLLSPAVRPRFEDGSWTEARLRLEYQAAELVDPETVLLFWFDSVRKLWVPAEGQDHDIIDHSVAGDVPGEEPLFAVFGALSQEHKNTKPVLNFIYDYKDAFVGEPVEFDASVSNDPDGTVLLFYWDFEDDSEQGPWTPGVKSSHAFDKDGLHEVILLAVDGEYEYFFYKNVSIRKFEEEQPGPWDNPQALFLLGVLLVVAFSIAIAYRIRRARTYDDLFGKAYRERESDEYAQLFRKLTEEELRGHPEDLGETPIDDLEEIADKEGEPGGEVEDDEAEEGAAKGEEAPEDEESIS